MDRAPAHPDNEVGPLVAGLEEALPGLRGGVAAIGDADLASDRLAAIQRLAAMVVSDLQMAEASTAQIVNAMDPPVGSFAAWLTEAGAVGDAQHPSMPARRFSDADQQLAHHLLQKWPCGVQALDQRVLGQRGDIALARPGRDPLHRVTTRTPRQSQSHQVDPGSHPARAPERLGLARQGFQVDMRRDPRQKGGEMINRRGGCVEHLRYESY